MIKKLHPRSKIFFPDPYVVRVEYPAEITMEVASGEFRKLTRQAYKLLKGTWGYCQLEPELVKVKDEFKHPTPPGPSHYAGLTPNVVIASLLDPDYQYRNRGYLCFEDELDALQFRLSLSINSMQVFMWPERWFTIHEVIPDES